LLTVCLIGLAGLASAQYYITYGAGEALGGLDLSPRELAELSVSIITQIDGREVRDVAKEFEISKYIEKVVLDGDGVFGVLLAKLVNVPFISGLEVHSAYEVQMKPLSRYSYELREAYVIVRVNKSEVPHAAVLCYENGIWVKRGIKYYEDADTVKFMVPIGNYTKFAVVEMTPMPTLLPTKTPTPKRIEPTLVETPTKAPTKATPTPTPGFEAVFAIAGLLAVAHLLRRK